MTTERNPSAGGSYVKAHADADPVFVEGTGREQTPQEKAAAKAAIDHAEKAAAARAAAEKKAALEAEDSKTQGAKSTQKGSE